MQNEKYTFIFILNIENMESALPVKRKIKKLWPYVHDFMPITNTSFLQLHNLLFAVLTVHTDKNIFYMWQVVLTVILGSLKM